MTLAVIAASRDEIAPLFRALERRSVAAPLPFGLTELVHGEIGTTRVSIGITGEGAHRARTGLAALLRAIDDVDALIVLGIAGGLDPRLAAGDVVVGAEVRDDAEGRLRASQRAVVKDARDGVVVSVPTIVAEVEQRRALYAKHREDAAVVDLESYAWAELASRRQLPWIVVRAVSDCADEELPAILAQSQRADGSIDRARVALRALTAPRTWPTLARLRRRVAMCSERLTDACVSIARSEITQRPKRRLDVL